MKLLTFSTLFPNAEKPNHGIFVETRLRYLLASGRAESRVVAPVPWFPSKHPRFGRYAGYAKVPKSETRSGMMVDHPRYVLPPKVGMTLAPFLLAQSVKSTIRRIIDSGYDFDLIDAHYFYPDGVAAIMLGRHFNKPVAITARGTDINLIPRFALPRKQILWAAQHAQGMITVCNALKEEMVGLGIDGARITPLRNGVDLERFQPVDRAVVRASLGMHSFTLLSVGLLEPRKAHDLIISALPSLPDVQLMIAGSGPERSKLEALTRRLNVEHRVKFLGALPQTELRNYYGAADAMVLASSREGWANVLLESMACGTPVVASNVWGTPEVVAAPEAGVLMAERTAQGVADAVKQLRANYPSHEATRRYAEKFSWDDTTQGQLHLFDRILMEHRS
ncbi:glycosyltransferase involved in cell wall biosynthesis [Paucimonas lemoignei]|uniref:Glycosyltransferase involved in cell wall biosynthesis n=1 Tax=Paucimonas lemoignei TaxID=29443 RepID=A0A4R3HZ89_PAULE|nr:glycosyltransferase family 4 protein [Paucimonas lemoignei]TCS38562.1 glycosyltransferase involved in cell wall biosynthesis [Paucimonas lemoignei]